MNTNILNKSTGDFLTANEFNTLNNAINSKIDGGFSITQLRQLSDNDLISTKLFYCNEVGKEGFWKYDSTDVSFGKCDILGALYLKFKGFRTKKRMRKCNHIYISYPAVLPCPLQIPVVIIIDILIASF